MRLKDYLENRKESQAVFAARAGVSQQRISELCTTGAGCRIDTAKAIIEATGGLVTMDDLQPEPAA